MSSSPPPPPFYPTLHSTYISNLPSKLNSPSSYEGAVTEHLRMSGIYWSLTALSLLHPLPEVDSLMTLGISADEEDETSVLSFVMKCYDPITGGFSGNIGHDAHLLYTLSAIQILALADRLDLVDKVKVGGFISELQREDGSFAGDQWGEIDTRFSYCAVASLSILGLLHGEDGYADIDKAAAYVLSCQNFDGGFGCITGAESHAGQIFCCVGALSILGKLEDFSSEAVDLLCWWLAERQCDSGGLNGRPEKQADVCYSWWILSSLAILNKVNFISTQKLADFILKCQDDEDGGIADRPANMADVFHTFFGISGLSLIGYFDGKEEYEKYRSIDPVYALPTDVVRGLELRGQVVAGEDGVVDDRLKSYTILTRST